MIDSLSSDSLRIQRFLDRVDRRTERLGLNVPQIVDLEKLKSSPPGSFGRGWADFLEQHQLKPLTTGARRKQLHDGVHVLTGFGTDALAEAEVQAFMLGAKFHWVNLALLLGLLRLSHQQSAAAPYAGQSAQGWQRLGQAYQRGCNSRFDPDTWQPELLWERPLTEVQALFGV